MLLQSSAVSHWLNANLESALYIIQSYIAQNCTQHNENIMFQLTSSGVSFNISLSIFIYQECPAYYPGYYQLNCVETTTMTKIYSFVLDEGTWAMSPKYIVHLTLLVWGYFLNLHIYCPEHHQPTKDMGTWDDRVFIYSQLGCILCNQLFYD